MADQFGNRLGGMGMASLGAALVGLLLMEGCAGRQPAILDTCGWMRRRLAGPGCSSTMYRALTLRGGTALDDGSGMSSIAFDPTLARKRMEMMWSRESITFGEEQSAMHIHREEWITDRLCLTKGFEIVRDDLQLSLEGLSVCTADLSGPSVASILGRFSCGESFSTVFFSELSHPKYNYFDAASMQSCFLDTSVAMEAANMLGDRLRSKLYKGNIFSYELFNMDVVSHVDIAVQTAQTKTSRLQTDGKDEHSCVLRCLRAFDPDNSNHVQIRRLLGESNYEFLSSKAAGPEEEQQHSCLIAGCVLAVQGMREILEAMSRVLDGRGMCHATASLLTDKAQDRMLYCARGSAFDGQIREQGMGTDARKYKVHRIVHRDGNSRFFIKYGDIKYYDIYFMPYALREEGGANEEQVEEEGLLLPKDGERRNFLSSLWCHMQMLPSMMFVGLVLLGFAQTGKNDAFKVQLDALVSKGREARKWMERTIEQHRRGEELKRMKKCVMLERLARGFNSFFFVYPI